MPAPQPKPAPAVPAPAANKKPAAKPARASEPRQPGPRKPAVRRRLKSEDRREQLLQQAVQLFSQHGFSGTRTKDIATACGVSESILFRHFATKEDLYHAILDTYEDSFCSPESLATTKRLAAARDDEGMVRSLALQLIKSFRNETAFHRLMLYARLEGHVLVDIFYERLGHSAEFLTGYIEQRQREGVFRPGEPRALLLLMFAPVVHYSMTRHLFGRPIHLIDSVPDETMVEEIVAFVLAGLRAPTKSSGSRKSSAPAGGKTSRKKKRS